MITCSPPVLTRDASETGRPASKGVPGLSAAEQAALQELADRHGVRWRTVLLGAHDKGTLTGILRGLMSHPEAGNKIARAVIIPRSLPPVALYYGPLHF